MTEVIPWGVALIIGILGGGLGWYQARRHGEEKAGRKTAERERDVALDIAARRGDPLETRRQRQRSACLELERRMRKLS